MSTLQWIFFSNLSKGRTAYDVDCEEKTAYPINQSDGSDSVLYAVKEGIAADGGLIGDKTNYADAEKHIENFFNRAGHVALEADKRIYYAGEHEGLPVCLEGTVVK